MNVNFTKRDRLEAWAKVSVRSWYKLLFHKEIEAGKQGRIKGNQLVYRECIFFLFSVFFYSEPSSWLVNSSTTSTVVQYSNVNTVTNQSPAWGNKNTDCSAKENWLQSWTLDFFFNRIYFILFLRFCVFYRNKLNCTLTWLWKVVFTALVLFCLGTVSSTRIHSFGAIYLTFIFFKTRTPSVCLVLLLVLLCKCI